MSYLAELRALDAENDFSDTPNSGTVETVDTPSKPSLDSLDSTPTGPSQKIHGFTRRELLALADPGERADLEASPEALEAFGKALRLAEIRERGERPAHYTRAALCDYCGPVWLFPGDATRVLGCPWCENTANGRPIPRPLVACADCGHWRPDSINPAGGLGSCTTAAPASMRPGSCWPRGEITCGDWRPKSEEHPA